MMREMKMLLSFAFTLVIAGVACAGHRSSSPAQAAGTTSTAQSPSAAQGKPFIPVEGADLVSKIDAAMKKARVGSSPTPFWTAYGFDVRPGVGVDANVREFHGSMQSWDSDTNVVVGTSRGMTVETRHLGVFLLRDANSGAITRVEVYNLERPREYGGHPVYWLGRAANEESLNFLRSLAESSQTPLANEHATLAIALHDDPRVADILKNFVRKSTNPRTRSTSVFWLGQTGGEHVFLADLVRNEQESDQFRRHAAHAVGQSRDPSALVTLQSLYESIARKDVKRGIIHAVADNENKDAAYAFLLKVAKTDVDRDARKQAIHRLGDTKRETVIDELMKIYAGENDTDIKRQVLHALSQIKSPRAEAKLLEIARTSEHPELRKNAIHWLGQNGTDPMVGELMRLYEAERVTDVKKHIVHALAQMKSARAEDKLFEIARGSDSVEMRRQAIHRIGEKAGRRSLELLRDTVDSSGAAAEIQMQAVHAIGERPPDEAIPLLIKIAKTHANAAVRKRAIHRLGETGDPRALEFFREVLTK
ncbi:MAG: HEAT repeat domain-containing protein [Pyrinomonadaceae bacterium]|nr:HEAT repeat domain-containing protein [Pyrinomonadaceae bacterium]